MNNINIKTNQIGAVQGDVPILRVKSLTRGGKRTNNRIVAMGEVTGHNHVIEGSVECYEVERDLAGQLFRGMEVVVAEGESAYLRHTSDGEHRTIEMMPGIYFIPAPGQQQMEYDGRDERRVKD